MQGNGHLNGCDYLMLGFDHELRRQGFAGNSCQIVLELSSAISAETLKERLAELLEYYPILQRRPGGVLFTKWKSARNGITGPQVRVHRNPTDNGCHLFNEPLAIDRGELLRFDLLDREGGRMRLVFTWTHALMDAPGAEHLLAMIGRGESPSRAERSPALARPRTPLKERAKCAWKYLDHLDEFCKAPPRAIGVRHPAAPATLEYRVEKFSDGETQRVRANSMRLCGIFGDAQYHAAVSILELHHLHQRLGCPSPSYVLPLAVGLRRKGSIEPLFSNQVSMLMFQFLPEHLDSVDSAVDVLKIQTGHAMRAGLLESGRTLSELFRFLPLSIYVALLKHGLRGEICSLFYGETNEVHPKLLSFLGATVEDFTHVAAVTPSPGVGVIFYYFRGTLRLTVLHSARVLDQTEAAAFAASIRQQLLNP